MTKPAAAFRSPSLWDKLGPGLMYAGAAIGVSHLVQSTRAGAEFGFALIWVVVAANVLKYPFFEFSFRYVAATGSSLLDGYKKLGNWALHVFNALTILTMFTIQAAVTVVTAGILQEITGIELGPKVWSGVLLAACLAILLFGRYSMLDKVMKGIILLLSITTIASVLVAASGEYSLKGPQFSFSSMEHLFFLAALIGWMPAPIDISVWTSIWSEEKNKTLPRRRKFREAGLDFQLGFWGTTILAALFVSLGAMVMHGSGEKLSPNAVQFASQLISMFTTTLGAWTYPIIALAAVTTMVSTTLGCLDAFPRVLNRSFRLLLERDWNEGRMYFFWALLVSVGSLVLLVFFMENMRMMVDFATTIAFVTAPVVALLNFLVMSNKNIRRVFQPPLWLRAFAGVGLVFLTLFSLAYLWLKYFLA